MQDNDRQAPDEDNPNEETSTLGQMLRAAREDQELTVEQIAAELRVEPRFLTSLELDKLEDFSAPVFAKGFLKQYGQRLGLDYGDLLARYYRQVDVREVPMVHRAPIRLRDEPQITQWVFAGTALVVVVGGLSMWWANRPEAPVVGNQPAVVSEEPIPEPPEVFEPAPTAPGPLPPAAPQPEPAELVAEPAPDDSASPVEESELPAEPMVVVEISFEEDCWTEVTGPSGERLFYGLGRAGARTRFAASPPVSFFLGNADGVSLTVDGRQFSVPADSRQGNLARFVVLEAGP